MTQHIPESDWKKLRDIRPLALQRFCQKTLLGLKEHLQKDGALDNAHETYLKIFKHIHEEDKVLTGLFDDWRRSTVHMTLMGWLREGLLTENEFNTLSEETKSLMQQWGEIHYYQSD